MHVFQIWKQFHGFLRTQSRDVPSERTTKWVMAHLIVSDFLNLAPSATMREIRIRILKGNFERQFDKTAQSVGNEAA